MACCLTAPSHYLNQCWLIISKLHLHSSEGNFIRDTTASIAKVCLKIAYKKIDWNLPGANEWSYVKYYSFIIVCLCYEYILHFLSPILLCQTYNWGIVAQLNRLKSFWCNVAFILVLWAHFPDNRDSMLEINQTSIQLENVRSMCDLCRSHSDIECVNRVVSRLAPSQWEMTLQSTAVSHWLDAN